MHCGDVVTLSRRCNAEKSLTLWEKELAISRRKLVMSFLDLEDILKKPLDAEDDVTEKIIRSK